MENNTALEAKLVAFIKSLLKLGEDTVVTPESNLVDEVGLDSIEAFEAVATLHDIMDVTIPEDFNAKSVTTVRQLATYIGGRFSQTEIDRLLVADVEELSFSWN